MDWYTAALLLHDHNLSNFRGICLARTHWHKRQGLHPLFQQLAHARSVNAPDTTRAHNEECLVGTSGLLNSASPLTVYALRTTMRKKRFDNKSKNRRKVTREDDATYRLTHLWAAAHLLAERAPTVSQFYIASSRQICRRINLKTDSVTIKRSLCKKCNSLTVPGVGVPPARVRQTRTREKCTIVTCGKCGHKKRYPSRNPGRALDHAALSKPAVEEGREERDEVHVAQEMAVPVAIDSTEQQTGSKRRCALQ